MVCLIMFEKKDNFDHIKDNSLKRQRTEGEKDLAKKNKMKRISNAIL